MRFPFPPAEPEQPLPTPEVLPIAAAELAPVSAAFVGVVAEQTEAAKVEVIPEPMSVAIENSAPLRPVSEPECDDLPPRPAPLPRPRPKPKVIAFPRQATEPPPTMYRLADPVITEPPRILDVPEELEAFPATPLLDGLHLPPSKQAPAAPADHVELPFQAVTISQRLYAALIDCLTVAGGAAVFAGVSYGMLPKLALSKPVMLAAAALPVLLWAVYQYLFLLYGGATAGMRIAGIRLRTFKGTPSTWRHRRSRAIGLYFSTACLLMGIFWALVDVDALCWHDRISHTYLSSRE